MNLQSLLGKILVLLDQSIIPFIMAIAFFFFLFSLLRYFIIDGANEESQTKAKSLAIWGILAFVLITTLWGIVNLFASSFGINDATSPIQTDYVQEKSS